MLSGNVILGALPIVFAFYYPVACLKSMGGLFSTAFKSGSVVWRGSSRRRFPLSSGKKIVAYFFQLSYLKCGWIGQGFLGLFSCFLLINNGFYDALCVSLCLVRLLY